MGGLIIRTSLTVKLFAKVNVILKGRIGINYNRWIKVAVLIYMMSISQRARNDYRLVIPVIIIILLYRCKFSFYDTYFKFYFFPHSNCYTYNSIIIFQNYILQWLAIIYSFVFYFFCLIFNVNFVLLL